MTSKIWNARNSDKYFNSVRCEGIEMENRINKCINLLDEN